MSIDGIRISTRDHVGWIELDRPEKKNAFTPEMLREWGSTYRRFEADPDVRVVAVTGTGDAFCSGADLGSLARGASSPLESRRMMTEYVQPVALAADDLTKPLIMGLNGVAVGAGLDMALAGDYRLAADTARFSEGYIRVGLVPGDGGCHYLPPIIGRSRALHMLWNGEFVDAATALNWGLVDEVHPFDKLRSALEATAARLAAQPPVAVQLIKRAVRAGAHGDLRLSLDLIASHQAVVQSTHDSAEAVAAFTEHRKPHFEGR
ncbi:enoyl-CoA hydratase [Rhodococcus sp. 06-412-2C]|uniref:enoyl-CoA hydratase/isomerase family protein n=1 Tax=unclassified Rhodococcus (in: high G+C Gram-positive bacteria) TaxID=192944 RepID=UPI000B9B19BF|nr:MULTISPECIES: enoyl-CoA hydratase/isomerase family protein [unclassified Rhodococcus (in: high G+C Gram-positive bacteria)]OZC84647.1 enoyl-CoA hydratase [Rhodococcus sp. 06-412-2C]OZC98300.1 enoyl-CoA hydratase [Rhodococcus sp. 06-412-2B]